MVSVSRSSCFRTCNDTYARETDTPHHCLPNDPTTTSPSTPDSNLPMTHTPPVGTGLPGRAQRYGPDTYLTVATVPRDVTAPARTHPPHTRYPKTNSGRPIRAANTPPSATSALTAPATRFAERQNRPALHTAPYANPHLPPASGTHRAPERTRTRRPPRHE